MTAWLVVASLAAVFLGQSPTPLACPAATRLHVDAYYNGGRAEWCERNSGVKHGPSRSFYPNRHMTFSGEYLDGAEHGHAVYYFNDGTVWRRDEWNEGALVTTWLNPSILTLSKAELERLGSVDTGNDVAATFCEPNDTRSECRPKRRVPRSPTAVLRYENGATRARGSVRYGERQERWSFYYPSGRLAKRAEYLSGELTGPYQEWSENGRPAAAEDYLDGEKVGLWRYWDAHGRVRSEHYGRK